MCYPEGDDGNQGKQIVEILSTKGVDGRLSSDRAEIEPEIVVFCPELGLICGSRIIVRLKEEGIFLKTT